MFSPQHFKNKFMNEKELKELLDELLKKDESDSYIEFKENGLIEKKGEKKNAIWIAKIG